MNCIIIEDQPPAQRILKKYIEDLQFLQLKAVFPDAIQAMQYLPTENIDLIFLDIHLPKISGIEFLKTVQNPPHVILTTAFQDYALESYEFNVVDYLLKPFSFQRFVKAVSKVPRNTKSESSEKVLENSSEVIRKYIFIKSGHDIIKISPEDINYIKSDADYTELHLAEKKHLSSEPLRHWEQVLNDQQFVRVHKSYIINTEKIKKLSGNQIYLMQDKIIPIGRSYKEDFLQKFIT